MFLKEIFLIPKQDSTLLLWFRYEISKRVHGLVVRLPVSGAIGRWQNVKHGWRKQVLKRVCALKGHTMSLLLLFLPSGWQEMSRVVYPSFPSTMFCLTQKQHSQMART